MPSMKLKKFVHIVTAYIDVMKKLPYAQKVSNTLNFIVLYIL